jgi:Tfp pilus assembly major pilin PilA
VLEWKQLRWWSLLYAVVFALFSLFDVMNDFRRNHHWSLITLEVLAYSLMNFGNFVYALRLPFSKKPRVWKVLAPCFVLYFVFAGIVSEASSEHANEGLGSDILVWLLGFLFFLPTFTANLKLAQLWPWDRLPMNPEPLKGTVPASSGAAASEEVLWQAAVGEHYGYYLPRFAKYERTKRSFPSWHWPAFFVAFWWALYRKVWGGAILFLLLPILVGAAVLLAAKLLVPGDVAASDTAKWVGVLLSSALTAMLANGLYYHRVKARIEEAQIRYSDATAQLEYVARRGGTLRAIIPIAIGIFAGIFVLGIVAGIAVPAYRDYQTRAKVSKALAAVEPLKYQIALSWDKNKTVPREIDLQAFRQAPGAEYINNVRFDSGNVSITVVFGAVEERLNGKSIEWMSSRQPGYPLLWACRNVDGAPAQLLPPVCRH